jgi:hypothetical protein
MKLTCSICGDPCDEATGYRRVTGWERIRRSAGGTNAIRCPERSEVFACMFCVEKRAKGVVEGQESLL